MSANYLQELREELQCSLCIDFYNDPVSLPCLHKFCRECIERVRQPGPGGSSQFNCPMCRKVATVNTDRLPRDFQLAEIVDKFQAAEKKKVEESQDRDKILEMLICDQTSRQLSKVESIIEQEDDRGGEQKNRNTTGNLGSSDSKSIGSDNYSVATDNTHGAAVTASSGREQPLSEPQQAPLHLRLQEKEAQCIMVANADQSMQEPPTSRGDELGVEPGSPLYQQSEEQPHELQHEVASESYVQPHSWPIYPLGHRTVVDNQPQSLTSERHGPHTPNTMLLYPHHSLPMPLPLPLPLGPMPCCSHCRFPAVEHCPQCSKGLCWACLSTVHVHNKPSPLQPVEMPVSPELPMDVPYFCPITNMGPGKCLIVTGTPQPCWKRFHIDLQCTSSNSIALHFNPRTRPRLSNYVVCNSKIGSKFGNEEKHPFTTKFLLKANCNFEIKFVCMLHSFEIFVNDELFTSYKHRIRDLQSINKLGIGGDLMISSVIGC